MQENILEAYPKQNLKVYAIWTEKLFRDSRSKWDGAGMTDPRVVHLWDPEDASGRWFVDNLEGYRAGDWDAYLLFGPNASWGEMPAPLLASGSPVIGEGERLAARMRTLLRPPG